VGVDLGIIQFTIAANDTLSKAVFLSITTGNSDFARDARGNFSLKLNATGQLAPVLVNGIFDVGNPCVGNLQVVQSGVMNYAGGKRVFTLGVTASLVLDPTVTATTFVTVNVLNARNPPSFIDAGGNIIGATPAAPIDQQVDENVGAGNATGPAVTAFSPEMSVLFPTQPAILSYAIIQGNAANFFTINNATGQIAVGPGADADQGGVGLDFESPFKPSPVPNVFDLVVQAYDVEFPAKQAIAYVRVRVVDNDDPPVIGGGVNPIKISVIEDLIGVTTVPASDGKGGTIQVPNVIGAIYPECGAPVNAPSTACNPVGFGYTDDDNWNPAPTGGGADARDTVTYSVVSQGAVGRVLVNATSGVLTLATAVTLGPILTRPYLIVDGIAVRTVLRLTLRATDSKVVPRAYPTNNPFPTSGPRSVTFPVNVYVTVNSSYGGDPIVSGAAITGGATAFNAYGGDTLTITGTNFNVVNTLTGRTNVTVQLVAPTAPGSYIGTFRDQSCTVTSDTTILCSASSPAGYGTGVVLVVTWGIPGTTRVMATQTGSAVVMAFKPPVLSAVVVDNAKAPAPANAQSFSTAGGQGIIVSVSQMPSVAYTGNVLTVQYGPTCKEYTAVIEGAASVTGSTSGVPTGQVKATLVAGVDKSHLVCVTVGGQTTAQVASLFISYANPVISSITLMGNVSSVTAFSSVQSVSTPETFAINGVNFGGLTDALLVNMSYSATIAVNNVLTLKRYVVTPTCRKNSAVDAHTYIICNMPSGFGVGWAVSVRVGATGVSGQAATTLGYRAPTATRISGPGAVNAATQGGQAVIITGTGFGPLSITDRSAGLPITQLAPFSITYGHVGRPTEFVAVNCRVTTADTQVTCGLAPGTGVGLTWAVAIAGQSAPTPTFTTSYGPPVIASLSRFATVANSLSNTYLTQGGATELVYITGANFGPSTHSLADSDFHGHRPAVWMN
jgi:hypothetical protein